MSTPIQGLARSRNKARQSLEEEWQDMQMASFTNTSIKHAAIAMTNIGDRAVHVSVHNLWAQALRIRTGTHGQGLASYTKYIPINNKGLFEDSLSKVVVKATFACRNYKVLGDCVVLFGLSSPPREGS